MNRERRRKIKAVIGKLNQCSNDLDNIRDEEDYARDNTPENLQSKEQYEFSEECSNALDDAVTDIQEIVENLEDII